MKLQVVDIQGKKLRKIDVADEVFGIEPNRSVLHQAYVAQMGNRRVGSASTKTRGEVRGSTRKIRRQKGLGGARAGSNRAGTRVGGGVIFGPRPRSFRKDMPIAMRRLALRSALSSHAQSGDIQVVKGLVPEEAKTKNIAETLKNVGAERTTLLVTGVPEANLTRASRNLVNAKSVPAANLNVVDLINAHHVLLTEDAVAVIESRWGGEHVKAVRGRKQGGE